MIIIDKRIVVETIRCRVCEACISACGWGAKMSSFSAGLLAASIKDSVREPVVRKWELVSKEQLRRRLRCIVGAMWVGTR